MVHDPGRILHHELADNPQFGEVLFASSLSHADGSPRTNLLAIVKDLADRLRDTLVRMEGEEYVLHTFGLLNGRHVALRSREDREVRDMALMAFSEWEGMKGGTEGRADVIFALLDEYFARYQEPA